MMTSESPLKRGHINTNMTNILNNITAIVITLIIVGAAFFGSTKLDLWMKQKAVANCLELTNTVTEITDGGYTTNSKQVNEQTYNFCMQAKGYK